VQCQNVNGKYNQNILKALPDIRNLHRILQLL